MTRTAAVPEPCRVGLRPARSRYANSFRYSYHVQSIVPDGKERRVTASPDPFQDVFRDIMSRFAASVTVVTSFAGDRHHGLTVSAFTSVSLDPPLILICIDHTSHSIGALRVAGGFTVNMLQEGTAEVARKFASKDPDKFTGLASTRPDFRGAGLVLSSESYASLECRTVKSVEAGDHTVFIGHVENAHSHRPAKPLLYWQRDFHRLMPD